MVCIGSVKRSGVAKELLTILKLEKKIKINEVVSDYWKKEYFAPRPDSEMLINAKLNARNLNIMRGWKECLHEYVDQYYKNYF